MADNTTYHKLEHDVDLSSEHGQDEEETIWKRGSKKQYSLIPWLRPLCEAFLVLTVVLLTLKVLMDDRRPRPGRNEPQEDFGFVYTTFMNDTRYANEEAFTSEAKLAETLKQWVPLSPKGRGYIAPPAPSENYNLDAPPYLLNPLMRPNGEKEAYMLSGFHQLHCLSTILSSYSRLRRNFDQSELDFHIAHCFDYLRQGIICAADTTLEGNNSVTYPGVDIPWGTAHRCRNWDAVKDWADEEGRMVWNWPPGLDGTL